MADDEPVKKVKKETAPAEEKPVELLPVDEPKAEQPPVDKPKVEAPKKVTPVETPVEKVPEPVEEKVEEKPAEVKVPEPKVEIKPEAKEALKEEKKAEPAPAEKTPVDKSKAEAKPEAKAVPKEEKKASDEAAPAKKTPVDKSKATPKEKPVEEKPVEAEKPAPQPKVIGIPPNKLLLFDKYDLSEVTVTDAGLARYINLDPVMVPHTGARHANRPFAKSKMNIVERLVNGMMRTEDYTGKKTKTYSVVMATFSIIESKTKKNPVQVLIEALETTAPREEVTRLRYGGVSVPKAVDVSSSRRLDVALRNICKGAVKATYKNSKPIEICLANEIMLAAKGDMNSAAISKKEEVERIAASAR